MDVLIEILKVLLLLSPIIVVWYGYVFFTFFRYRFARQEELVYVLAAAAEAGAPLAPALWAYVRDRPRDDWRTFWMVVVLFFVLPGYYFYWRRHNFDHKVYRLATMLETGHSLHDAVRAARGAMPREVLLAAAVGESTGELATCLRLAPRWRLTPVWVDSGPRLFYPLLLLLSVYGIFAFLMLFIFPKFQKIFSDFKLRLPPLTEFIVTMGQYVQREGGWLVLSAVPLALLAAVGMLSPTFRWYCPGVRRLARMHSQSRLLRMLGLLLGAGKPVPEALTIIIDSWYFRGTTRKRLIRARTAVEQGNSLADSLYNHGLLPQHMYALVQAAERARHLPWALSELGDTLARRAVRISQRLSLAIFPIAVLAVGIFVACVAFGMFMPLITLINEVGR